MNYSGRSFPGRNFVGQDLRGVDFTDTFLVGADFTRADLRGAIFCGAHLGWADFKDANTESAVFDDAQWLSIPIRQAPILIRDLYYVVVILSDHMRIGCETHTIEEWTAFHDNEIVGMDGRNALRFWRDHKFDLLQLVKHPRFGK